MHVYCRACGYDSGDFDTTEQIAVKVIADGGHMELTHDPETGKPAGWNVTCPKGHADETRID
jgi:hypothetical protein